MGIISFGKIFMKNTLSLLVKLFLLLKPLKQAASLL